MQVFHGLDEFPDSLRGCAVSIGKFDGMHLGHALIVHRLKSHAGKRGIPAIVLTFDPPPITILRPDLDVRPICTLRRKIELVRLFNVDAMLVFRTTPEFLRQSAETFFFGTLQGRLQANIVVAGRNFTFGRDRVGNADSIRRYGDWAGIEVDIVEPVQLGEHVVSSSGIRELIRQGRVERVNELMPLPYRLSGVVQHGVGRGRTLGFPTANLDRVETILPQSGVYASVAWVDGRRYAAATHVGRNLTFDQPTPTVETFLLDFDGDLYGRPLDVDLLAFLRESVRFDSREELVRQIEADLRICREISNNNALRG